MKTSILLLILLLAIACNDELVAPIQDNNLIEHTENSKRLFFNINSTSESVMLVMTGKNSVDTTIIRERFYSCYHITKEKWARVFTFIDQDRVYEFTPNLKE